VRSSPSEVRSSGGKTGFVKPKTYSGSSGKTYSGSTKKTYSGGSTGKTYSGGSNSTIRNRKPSPPKLQIIKAENIKKYRNSDYYRKAHPAAAPRSSYTTSSGRVIVINQRDAHVDHLRRQLSWERWQNREMRRQHFYGAFWGTYLHRPVIFYNDPFDNYFIWWAYGRPWWTFYVYNHWLEFAPERRVEIIRQDPSIERRLAALEAQNRGIRNADYVPSDIANDRDMQYNKDYVEAVYNPQVQVPVEPQEPLSARQAVASSDFVGARSCIITFLVIVGVVVVGVLIFKGVQSTKKGW